MSNAAPPVPTARPRHTLRFLTAFYLLAVVWGVRSIRPDEPSGMDLLFPPVFALCLGWWAVVDARRRRHPIPLLSRSWFYFLAEPLVPLYVLWSRGWRGACWLVLNTVLWYAIVALVVLAGRFVVYGQAWPRSR